MGRQHDNPEGESSRRGNLGLHLMNDRSVWSECRLDVADSKILKLGREGGCEYSEILNVELQNVNFTWESLASQGNLFNDNRKS